MARRAFMTALALTITAARAGAQQSAVQLNAEKRTAVLEEIVSLLHRRYVFPDVAAQMSVDLQARAGRGEYDTLTHAASFADVLTRHLQAISHDKHLRVRTTVPGAAGGAAGFARGERRAFGRSERLAGDVAYVEILSFGFPPEAVRAETESIMSAAADAKAIIVDLRANGGGSPHMVALVTSYLFGEEPVHLNSLYFRPADRTDHFYTDPRVSGKKFGPNKPVYVLTSARTFSGAEEFAYNLQTRKRATIVGETTGGGANPGGPAPLPHGLTIFVPTGRAINPITKTNWERVGVKPDVPVRADSALAIAHELARKAVVTPTSVPAR